MMTCHDCERVNDCPKGILFQGEMLTSNVEEKCDKFIKGGEEEC